MYIVLDMKKMLFLPIKHGSMYTTCDLLWIEGPRIDCLVTPLDQNFLNRLTDLELTILYKNTTGQPAQRVGNSMRQILFEIASRIPERDANAFEAYEQAKLVPDKPKGRYFYNKGAFTPGHQPTLFDLDYVQLPKSPDELQIASRPRVGPQGPAPVLPRTSAPTPIVNGATRPAGGLRQGGVAPVIWAVADKLWEAAGKPTDPQIVLKLRKEMMSALETENGVKRTTSSNELGNWMKSRIIK